MEVKGKRIDGFLARPDPGVRAVLLHGPDAGLVRERAALAGRSVVEDGGDPFRVADLQADVLDRDPARLADEAAAMSLTGGRRLVRVRGAGDGLAPLFERFLAGPPPGDSLVVVEAGELAKSSKLRKAFEASDAGAAIACYPEDEGDLRRVVAEQLRAAGLAADGDALDLLAASLVGDRMVARTEADKLVTYMLGRSRVTADDVRAVIGDSADLDLGDPAWAAADGDYAATDRALGKLFGEGTSPVPILRAGQTHLQRLQLAVARAEGGEGLEAIGRSLWGPIFWKLKDRVAGQMRRWSDDRLARAQERLLEAEALCKRTGYPEETVCARAFLQVAQMARGGAAGPGRR